MNKTCPECGYPAHSAAQVCPECGYLFSIRSVSNQPKGVETGKTERYQTLSREQVNLYAKGSPVIIAAMALLKDRIKGRIIGQIKFQNISPMPIKALVINVKAFDVMGKELEGISEFQYIDLHVNRDEYFGQNIPIVMPNPKTRIFSVEIVSVLRGFGVIDNLNGATWEKLPNQVLLRDKYPDDEINKQFSIEFGPTAEYESYDTPEIWFCMCGKYNSQKEEVCHVCGLNHARLPDLDMEMLQKNKEARVHEEAQHRMEEQKKREEQLIVLEQQRQKEKQEKIRRIKRIVTMTLLPALAIMLFIIAFWGVPKAAAYIKPIIHDHQYNKALVLINQGRFDEGYELLMKSGVSNAETVINESKYHRALALVENKNYNEACILFEELGEYSDAEKQLFSIKCDQVIEYLNNGDDEAALAILSQLEEFGDEEWDVELEYMYAQACMNKGDYESAIRIFESNPNYKDAKVLQNEAMYLLAKRYAAEENCEKAASLFKRLSNYKDSAEQYEIAKKEALYVSAVKFMNNGSYYSADLKLTKLVDYDYKDSIQLLKECKYYQGMIYLEHGTYRKAIDYFTAAGDYRDSVAKKEEAQNLLNSPTQHIVNQYTQALTEEQGISLNYSVWNTWEKDAVVIHSLIAQLADNGDYDITVDCTLSRDTNISCYNTPQGMLFRRTKENCQQGRNTYVYTLSREEVEKIDAVTLSFYPNDGSHQEYLITWNTDQLY